MAQKLSFHEAQKIALLSQKLLNEKEFGTGKEAVFQAIDHVGYIQIDTISVVQRAHHHSLWNRTSSYKNKHLSALQEDKKIFEYWSHAAAYLPMRSYRYCLPNMNRIAGGEKHWYDKDKKIMDFVLKRIKEEGPLQARDFEDNRASSRPWWDWKPAKRALEQQFMEGRLMVLRRDKFKKVYDLTERVLPDDIDTSMPSEVDYIQFLIFDFLKAHGLGTEKEMGYLRKGLLSKIKQVVMQLVEEGELIEVEVNHKKMFTTGMALNLLNKRLPRTKLKILSPFDNFIIQRQRIKNLFQF